jgi:hypothetical protein
LYGHRVGIPWRDIPERFLAIEGSVHLRFGPIGEESGVFERRCKQLQPHDSRVILDTAFV